MARIVKEADERRAELLDAARSLFFERGYEGTSVNAIIERIGVSKGAFYHYFDSKEDLLDALVERLTDEAVALTQPIIEQDGLSALERLNRFFATLRGWKAEQMPLMMAVMRGIYRDENLALRHKMMERNAERMAPLLARLVAAGVEEGVLDTAHPALAGEMVLRVGAAFSDMAAGLILRVSEHPENVGLLREKITMYQDAIERVLGAPSGALALIDDGFLRALQDASGPEQEVGR